MSLDHMADSESEELYVEDLDLGDISGVGLSGVFAAKGDQEVPTPLDDDEAEEPVELEHEESPKPKKKRSKRGGILGGISKIKDTFAEELEKARAEEAAKKGESPAPDEADEEEPSNLPPLEVPEIREEKAPETAPLEVPDLEDDPDPTPSPLHAPGGGDAPLEVPAFDADEELIYEEPDEPDSVEPPAPSHAPHVEDEEAPLLFEQGDEPDEDEDGGFLGMLRQRWAMAKAADKESHKRTGPEGAGVDISPPGDSSISSLIGRLTGRNAEPVLATASSAAADESGFAALLKPLSGSEVAMLQAELANDETVFAKIDRSRRDMANRQLFGFLIGIACLVFFAVSSGRHYLLDVLPNAAQPSWIPDSIQGDTAGAGIYALGLLVPLVSLFVIADAVRYLMSSAVLRRVDDLLMGMVAAVCSMGALYSCAEGQVISGATFLVAYGVVYYAARFLGVKKG